MGSLRGGEGKKKRVIVVPDEGRSPSEVESGLLYVHEHCARAFTPLNTQRQHTEIQRELWKCTVYTRQRERGKRREKERAWEAERSRGWERGREGEWSRKRKPALANHPKMGYTAFVCVYVCAYIYFVHDQPRLRQRTSKPLVFPISCDVRYAHIPGVLAIRGKEISMNIVRVFGGIFRKNFSSAKPG